MEYSDELPMDHSDLTPLDHRQWKMMLPPDKQELVWRSTSLRFFLDKMTGKNCFLLGATTVLSGYNWEMRYHPKIDMRVRIKTQMLSPDTLYAAYLEFKLSEKNTEVESVISIIRLFHDESLESSQEQARILHFERSNSRNSREDGWMEKEMGDFYVGEGENIRVEVQLVETKEYNMRGLIVEGIEFRPLEGKRNTRRKGISPKLKIS